MLFSFAFALNVWSWSKQYMLRVRQAESAEYQ